MWNIHVEALHGWRVYDDAIAWDPDWNQTVNWT